MYRLIRLTVLPAVVALLLVAAAAPVLANGDNGDNADVWYVCPTLGHQVDDENNPIIHETPATVKPKANHPSGKPHPAFKGSLSDDEDTSSAEPGDVFWVE